MIPAVFFNAVRATFARHRMARRSVAEGNEGRDMDRGSRRERGLPASRQMPETGLRGDGPQQLLMGAGYAMVRPRK